MAFYLTSSNCKKIRDLLIDFVTTPDITPYEYMEHYVEKFQDSVDKSKLTWIVETFISIQKHMEFLRTIVLDLSDELKTEEQDYFIIVFQQIIFSLNPIYMKNIYKTLFNLSRALLKTFTDFLSNNEVLTYLADVAQNYYDASYITTEIISPLHKWQPYISEMVQEYAEYVKKEEDRKLKPLTEPLTPRVLTRKGKKVCKNHSQPIPTYFRHKPNIYENRSMLSKSAIDRKIKAKHEENKHKAAAVIDSAKARVLNFPQLYKQKKVTDLELTPTDQILLKPKKFTAKAKPLLPVAPVRENVAAIKRINKIVKKSEEEELKRFENMILWCTNTMKVEELLEEDRIETEKERLYEIEKKHLMGQITHERALLAKQNIIEMNKKKAEKLIEEEKAWEDAIEQYREEQMQKYRKAIEKTALIELRIQELKQAQIKRNQAIYNKMKEEQKAAHAEILRVKQEELEQKIAMVKEIKILSIIAKRTSTPKIIDLTETAGLGLMCEMSIAELQERLAAMKMAMKDDLEMKRAILKENKEKDKRELEEQKNNIKEFMSCREDFRRRRKKSPVVLSGKNKSELDDLKKILAEKRQERLKFGKV